MPSNWPISHFLVPTNTYMTLSSEDVSNKCGAVLRTNSGLLGSRGLYCSTLMLNSQQRLSGASCVSFVWLINEHSSAVWAAEKMECLRFCSYVTILSLLPRHPPSKADELWLLPGLEWKHVRSTAETKMYSPELWKTHASHTVFLFFSLCVRVCVSEGHMFDFISPAATGARQKIAVCSSHHKYYHFQSVVLR